MKHTQKIRVSFARSPVQFNSETWQRVAVWRRVGYPDMTIYSKFLPQVRERVMVVLNPVYITDDKAYVTQPYMWSQKRLPDGLAIELNHVWSSWMSGVRA